MFTALMLSALSIDQTLTQWVATYGVWALGLVALIIFAETGLVIAPFLPGDSLLFITGTLIAASALNVHTAVLVLALAAIAGDGLNFAIGRRAAPWILARLRGRWLRQSHLDATQRYFQRFGAVTIVVARFVPIVRTLAPFLAGAGAMPYRRFVLFNVLGGVGWVAALVYAGAFLGSQPLVRNHLGSFTLGIVALSAVPMIVAGGRAYRTSRLRTATASTPPGG